MSRGRSNSHSGELHRQSELKGLYKFAYVVLFPIMKVLTRPHYSGQEHLPENTGFIVAPNHISSFDPINIAYFLGDSGLGVRYLAKGELFRVPLLGPLLTRWGMVPVQRGTDKATDSLSEACEAVAQGDPVGIYFEGTLTRDPAFWPMRGKTGIARVALDSKAPVVPIVQWGPQNLLERNLLWPRLRRNDIYVKVLPPLDLSDIKSDSSDHDAVRIVVERLQEALAMGVGELRDQMPPKNPWDRGIRPDQGSQVLHNFSRWRRQLARINGRQEILAAKGSVERCEIDGAKHWTSIAS